MMEKTRVLIVEDERIAAEDLKISLENLGYDITASVSTGEEAIIKAVEEKPDLVLMDIKLQGKLDGIEAAKKLRSRIELPVVYLTAHSDEKTLRRAKITEPFGYIIKPFENRELNIVIEMAIYKWRMENRLKETEKWFSTALWSIGDAVIATNMKGAIHFMNPAAEKLTKWNLEDAVGKPMKQVLNIIDGESGNPVEDPFAESIEENSISTSSMNIVLIARDGTRRPIEESLSMIKDEKGNTIGNILVLRDIKEHKLIEEESKSYIENLEEEVRQRRNELVQFEKMASLGSLVASVAHEINNPLAYIKSNTEFINEGLSAFQNRCKDSDRKHILHFKKLALKNLEGIQRIDSIAQTLRRFAKPDSGNKVSTDINLELEGILQILQNQLKYRVELKENYSPLPKILCNIEQLNQVFMNVILNASQSLDCSEIWIKTWSHGEHVYIEIKDNGKGIMKDELDKLFDPDLTDTDVMSGLSLHICRRILKENNGGIKVERDGKSDTRTIINLPIEVSE
jgi:PAS domain S-box-containing protein